MDQPFRYLKAVVFDWAGTMVDHGSLAPMGVFVEAFARFGIELTIDEARGPMGMAKRPHIAALMALPRIAEAWRRKHGRDAERGRHRRGLQGVRADERRGGGALLRCHPGRRRGGGVLARVAG